MSRLYGKPSKQLVFDLINAANPGLPYPVTGENTIIEGLQVQAATAVNNYRNTKVRLRGLQGSGFSEAVWLNYDRIDFANLFNPAGTVPTRPAITSFTGDNLVTLLPVINRTYGLAMTAADIVQGSVGGSGTANYSTAVNLAAATGSLAFSGSTALKINRGLAVLGDNIKTTVLDTLNHPIANPAKQCIDMITWDIDLTTYKNLLTIDSSGIVNWAGLRKVLDGLGVPAYDAPLNSNYVADAATSTVTNANPLFDRVVVHTGINNDTVMGVAYYHYNS